MLVITRKPGEAVFIGESKIIVSKSPDGRIRLAIEAPKGVKVLRAELVGAERKVG